MAPASGSSQINRQRDRHVFWGTAASFLAKLTVALSTLVVVPIGVAALGVAGFGVWTTISSLVAWVQALDFGLPNALLNELPRSGQRAGETRKTISVAFRLLCGVAILTSALAWASSWFVDWPHWLGVSASFPEPLGPAVAWAVSLAALALPFAIVEKALFALQKGAQASLWLTTATVTSVVAFWAAARSDATVTRLLVAWGGAILVVRVLSALVLFRRELGVRSSKPLGNSGAVAARILRQGGSIFVIQVAALLIFHTDNLIIARYLGPTEVAQYSIAWRLFSFGALPQVILFPSLWASYADAVARGDIAWVRRTFFTTTPVAMAITLVFVTGLSLFGERLIIWWAGPDACAPLPVLIGMGAWTVINGLMSSLAALLNAGGSLRQQMLCGSATALANVSLSVFWVQTHGLAGVIAATSVAYLVLNVGPSLWEARRLLRLKRVAA